MKIGVNLSFIIDHVDFGIGSYIANILRGLQELDCLDSYYLIVRKSFYPRAKTLYPQANFIVLKENKWMYRCGRFQNFLISHDCNMIQIPKITRQENLDLMFYPFHAISNNMNLKIPIVMTVHDLFHCNYPENLSRKYLAYVKFRHQILIHHSDHIITISDFVKSDVLHFFPKVDPEHVHRIYNSIIFNTNKITPMVIEEPFILCVNSMRTHKNYITLIKAFHRIKDRIPHKLILVGRWGEASQKIKDFIETNRLEDRVIIKSSLSEGERNFLYRNADLFVSPSLHEGFGMTPVEAMLAKTSVITTKETSLYEATQGLAHYYEPAQDDRQLAKEILQVLELKESKDLLSQKAEQVAESYHYLTIAKEYDQFLKGVLDENRH
jgi:glycosyltransferase involved in cell wall biosynthesis